MVPSPGIAEIPLKGQKLSHIDFLAQEKFHSNLRMIGQFNADEEHASTTKSRSAG